MDKGIITFEAIRIVFSLGLLDKPNTPSGSQYMTDISAEFLVNANTNDMNTLQALVSKSVKGVYFSTLSGVRGHYYAFVKDKFSLKKLLNSRTELLLIHQHSEYALLVRTGVQADPSPFIVAWKLSTKASSNVTLCDWGQGHYMPDFSSAVNLYLSKIL